MSDHAVRTLDTTRRFVVVGWSLESIVTDVTGTVLDAVSQS